MFLGALLVNNRSKCGNYVHVAGQSLFLDMFINNFNSRLLTFFFVFFIQHSLIALARETVSPNKSVMIPQRSLPLYLLLSLETKLTIKNISRRLVVVECVCGGVSEFTIIFQLTSRTMQHGLREYYFETSKKVLFTQPVM